MMSPTEWGRAVEEAMLWHEAYRDQVQGAKAAIESWRDGNDPGKSCAKLYGAERAHGGYVVFVFTYPNQSDSYSIQYFENWRRDQQLHPGRHTLGSRIAGERLELARHHILYPSLYPPV